MEEIISNSPQKLFVIKPGDIVEGTIIAVRKTAILVDLDGKGIGIIFGRELGPDYYSRKYKVGDRILASVLDFEDEFGKIPLSLRKVGKGNVVKDLEEKFKKGEIIEVVPQEANRGGLIIEIGGFKGFLPTSQLSPEHYPRVEDGNKNEILNKLLELVGKPLKVKILDFDAQSGKLIFSEKGIVGNKKDKIIANFKVGQEVEGTITGIVDFGAFVDIGGIEGLIHISEISWEKVENVSQYLKIGEKVKAVVTSVDNGKVSLSIKRLQEDPFMKEIEDLKKGQTLEGLVSKIVPFGIFVKIKNNLEGLVHVSEIPEEFLPPEKHFQVDQNILVKILSIDKKERKILLALKNNTDLKSKNSKSSDSQKELEKEKKVKKKK